MLEFEIFKPYFSNLEVYITTRKNPIDNNDDFNMGFSGSDYDDVIEKRRILANKIGINPNDFVFQTQVHGNNYSIVDKGAGFFDKDSAIKDNDILITNQKKLAIVTRSADCTPVVLYDKKNQVLSVIHSGRKGTFLHASVCALKAMQNNFSSLAKDIIVAIGPAICQKCYQVDKSMGQEFLNEGFNESCISFSDDKAYLDLKKIIYFDLIANGVLPQNIQVSDYCTSCNNDLFYSYRKGDKQRFAVVAFLK